MNIFTTFKLALRALWRNKVRTSLTMLGIVFGIAAVISTMAAGQGAQASLREAFASLGTNVLMVSSGSTRQGGVMGGGGTQMSITWDDMQAIKDEVPTAKYVAPLLQARNQQIASDQSNWNTSVQGTTGTWFKIRAWDAAEGTVFDEDTGNSNAKIAVIGKTVKTQLFGEGNALNQTIRIQNQPYEVIGVLTSKGQGPMGDNDDIVVIPVKTFQQKLSKGLGKYIPGQILVTTQEDNQADTTIAKISGLLRDRHKLDASDDDDFRIRNPAEYAQVRQQSAERVSTLLAIVAAVSLLIGGIGVMNIMLVSVIERTREIGIRMAVGAKPRDVMTQFLLESIVLSTIGGVLGFALGYGGAHLIADMFGYKFFFPTETGFIAFAVSTAVGVGFGLYPAIRASQLDPITALRYET
ncbi:MAG TPA: ABC transporter permease [Kofleriaceae bacterium]|nr:ABC transporter permease [Kofleriaceae bacterium]